MTRVVSYNILAGGYSLREKGVRRTDQILKIIRPAQPDIIGFPEGIHPQVTKTPIVVEELAEALGMQLVRGGIQTERHGYQTALLTRLPIVHTKIHERPGILARPLIEVCVEESNGQHLTAFLTHLSAAFNRKWAGNHIRVREIGELLRIMAPHHAENKPHLLMGDFNSLAPHDTFKASELLKYVVYMDTRRRNKQLGDGHPHLNSVVPPKLRILNPILRTISRSQILCSAFDMAAYFYAPRTPIRLLYEKYEDSFRLMHPGEYGFTCPAAAPAGRIDYIFANKILADRLLDCQVLTTGEDSVVAGEASDHLAVMAEFGTAVLPDMPVRSLDDTTLDDAVGNVVSH